MKKLLITLFFVIQPLILISNTLDKDSIKVYQTPSVTVTATKAELGLSPIPFSEISNSEIENFSSDKDLPSLLNNLPSILFTSQSGNAIGYTSIIMRGFDQRRISVNINGIPQNDPEDHNVYWIDFPDLSSSLDNIQVQRGAGLASYGSASIGGSINLSTSNFIKQKGIKISSGIGLQQFGSDNNTSNTILKAISNKQSIEFSSGLVDNYAFYGRLTRISSDGYKDRSDAKLNSYFFSAVRFDENLSTQINIFGGPFQDGLAYNGIPKSYIKDLKNRRINPTSWAYDSTGNKLSWLVERRKEEREEFSQPHFEVINDWQISENIFLKNTLFYYTGEGYFLYDGSWADTTTLRITSNYGFNPKENPTNTLIKGNVTNNQFGLIPQLNIKFKNNDLSIGGELRFHKSEHWGKIDYAGNLPDNFYKDYKIYNYNGERDILSLYIRNNYSILENFVLTTELQSINHRFSINNEKAGNQFATYQDINGRTIGNNGEDIFNFWLNFVNAKLGLNYQINKNQNIYLFTAFTSREPRMRNYYAADDSYFGAAPLFDGRKNNDGSYSYNFSNPLVKEEKMLDFEFGSNLVYNEKNKFSINFYLMEYYDELVKSGKVDIFGSPIDGNVPRTQHYGLELDGKFNVLNIKEYNVFIVGNFTYSQNKIKEYNFITNSGDQVSLAGNQISGFPDMMGYFGLFGEVSNLFAGISIKFVGESRTDNFGDLLKTNTKLINHLQNDWLGYYDNNILDAYSIINVDLNYKFKVMPIFNEAKIQLQISNLLNELYATSGEGKEFFIAAERAFYFGLEINF